MDRVILAAPLLPERAEAWRRFCQEMMGRRRQQYERSRRRLKIHREAAWLVPTPHGAVAALAIDAPNPTTTIKKMATSQQPFDRWFRRNVFEIHGLDLSRPLDERADEPVFQWRCPEQQGVKETMTSQVTISREKSQEGVGWKRRIGFYVAGSLFLLVSLAFFGLMAGILTHAFTGWFQAAELGIHQLHEILGSAFFWSLIVAMIFTVVRPAQAISALRQVLAILAAFILVLLASLSEGLMGPLVMMSLLFVLAVATAALHPARQELLRLRGRLQPWLTGLTVVAAVPLLSYAVNQLQIQIGASPGDPHAEVGHWTIMSGYALAIVIYGALAGVRSAGWRVPAWSAGILAILFGVASLLLPTQASSVGVKWGVAAVLWGVVFMGRTIT